jgi:hypothetical protein
MFGGSELGGSFATRAWRRNEGYRPGHLSLAVAVDSPLHLAES